MSATPDHSRPAPGLGDTVIVWTGALVFAVSMGWFVYSYLVRFGRAAPPGPPAAPILIDVALFSAFALHHSVFARTGLKGRLQSAIPPHLERSLYTWLSSVLFLATCILWQPVPGVLYESGGVGTSIGAAAQVTGFVLTFLGARALDALDLAAVRPLLLLQRGERPAHVPLNTSGVFGLVRHPLYFGWALFVLGAPHMTATRAVFAIVSTGYIALAIPWEERSLVETFGEEYEAYRRKVRWRMLPGIY